MLTPSSTASEIKEFGDFFLEICHVRQSLNRAQEIVAIERQLYRPEIRSSISEAFSMAAVNQQLVLRSFSDLNAEEIVYIEERIIRADSAQSSSNKCRNYLLKIYL